MTAPNWCRIRRRRAAAAVLVAVGLVAACGGGVPGDPTAPGSSLTSSEVAVAPATAGTTAPQHLARVGVIGDSLTVQAEPQILDVLAARGHLAVVRATPGVDLPSVFVQEALDALVRDGSEVVVIATASNDVVTEAHRSEAGDPRAAQDAYIASVRAALARLEGRCVVLVGARDTSNPIYYPDEAAVLNANLQAEASRHQRVVVVDWAGISRPHTTDWFVADGLHVGPDPSSSRDTLAGAAAYADAIAGGVDRCPDPAQP